MTPDDVANRVRLENENALLRASNEDLNRTCVQLRRELDRERGGVFRDMFTMQDIKEAWHAPMSPPLRWEDFHRALLDGLQARESVRQSVEVTK